MRFYIVRRCIHYPCLVVYFSEAKIFLHYPEIFSSVAFEKLAITDSVINANINKWGHVKPKILEAIDHLKSISHKRPDVDLILEFIS